MILAKVRDKKTGVERTTSPKAYSIIPHRYVLLGYVDELGNPAEAPSDVNNNAPVRGEKKRSLGGKNVVAVNSEDKSGLPKITRDDLDRMNQEAMDKAKARIEAAKEKEEVAPIYEAPVLETLVYEKPVETPTGIEKKSPGRPAGKTKKK